MSQIFEMTLPIRSGEVDGMGRCKASALLGHMQEAATGAAEQGGFSRESTLERYGSFWMLTRLWYQVKRPLLFSEALTIRTWHRGERGASLYRDYDLFVGQEHVGECVSSWVLANIQTRALHRMSQVAELKGTDGGTYCKEKKLHKLVLPEEMELVQKRMLHYSDTDMNGHVNNTRYADFVCDALSMEHLSQKKYLSQLQIGYLAECKPGEQIHLLAGQQEDKHFVKGIDEAGKSRFEASVIFGDVSP